MKTLFAIAFATTVFGTNANAQDFSIGDLVVSKPTIRETPNGAKVGGGYLSVTNNGSTADMLIGGSASFAGKVEVHEMKMEGEVMKMRALPKGLHIPPGETVKLLPGGFHIMFMQLSEKLESGTTKKAVLEFAKAGKVEVNFDVKTIAETMKMKKMHGETKHSGHSMKKEDTSDHSGHGSSN